MDFAEQIIVNEANLIGSIIAAASREELRGFALLGEATLGVSDFKDDRHQLAWSAMLALLMEGQAPNAANLYARMTRDGVSSEVQRYILDLRLSAPDTDTVAPMVYVIRTASGLRRSYRLGGELQLGVQAALAGEVTPGEALRYIDRQLDEYTAGRTSGFDGVRMTDVIARMNDRLTDERRRGLSLAGISTGITQLDEYTGGLRENALHLVAALSGVGKTSLAVHLSITAAREKKRVIFYSLEMDEAAIARRMAAYVSGTSWSQFALLDENKRQGAMAEFADLPIVLYSQFQASMTDVLGFARREAARGGVNLIVIDHLQMVGWTGDPKVPRYAQLGVISRRLQELSESLRAPVVATAQLNPPQRMKGGDKAEPSSDDLRDSKEPFNACSVFVVLHQVRDKDGPVGEDYLLLQKNRFGPIGRVTINYAPATARVSDARPQAFDRTQPVEKDRW